MRICSRKWAKAAATNDRRPIKTWSRRSMILPDMVGLDARGAQRPAARAQCSCRRTWWATSSASLRRLARSRATPAIARPKRPPRRLRRRPGRAASTRRSGAKGGGFSGEQIDASVGKASLCAALAAEVRASSRTRSAADGLERAANLAFSPKKAARCSTRCSNPRSRMPSTTTAPTSTS